MKKKLYVPTILVLTIASVILYISKGDNLKKSRIAVEVTENKNIEVKLNKEQTASITEPVIELEVEEFATLEPLLEEIPAVSQNETNIETKAYEEALGSIYNKGYFTQKTNRTLDRFENEPQTAEGLALQASIRDKFFTSGSYDNLRAGSIEFSDATCKTSLCKIDFLVDEHSPDNPRTLISTELRNSFLNLERNPRIMSKRENGKVSYYVGTGFLKK